MTVYNDSAEAGLGFNDATFNLFVITVSESLGIDEATVAEAVYPLAERIGMSEVLDTLLKGQMNLSDGIGLNDAFSFFIELAAATQLGVADSALAVKSNAIRIADIMVLEGLADSRVTAMNVLSAIVGLIEGLSRSTPADILDKLGLTEAVLDIMGFAGLISDEIGIDENTSYSVGIFLEINEELALEDDVTLGQIIQSMIEDGVNFGVTLLGPGSAVYTGWIMNSENFAVSTYSNYEFTDMALINGQYYGVKEDGLFLLDGNLDDGAFIESIVRSAKLEFGTSNLKTVTMMYLGFRGDGNPVLKVVTDEKEETWYEVVEYRTDLRTATISLGKGQIGRYWQFEIVTTDSTQLELDSVELLPMVFKRKV